MFTFLPGPFLVQFSGPFYLSTDTIPFGTYRAFKKTAKEKKANQIEELAKIISIPREALVGGNKFEQKLMSQTNLVIESQPFVPFTTSNPFETSAFKSVLEAKLAIAKWLGYPLGRLCLEQITAIDRVLAQGLDKKSVMAQIKELFKIKLVPGEK